MRPLGQAQGAAGQRAPNMLWQKWRPVVAMTTVTRLAQSARKVAAHKCLNDRMQMVNLNLN